MAPPWIHCCPRPDGCLGNLGPIWWLRLPWHQMTCLTSLTWHVSLKVSHHITWHPTRVNQSHTCYQTRHFTRVKQSPICKVCETITHMQGVWNNHPYARCVKQSPICKVCEIITHMQGVWNNHPYARCVKQSPICKVCETITHMQGVWNNHPYARCVKQSPICKVCETITHMQGPCQKRPSDFRRLLRRCDSLRETTRLRLEAGHIHPHSSVNIWVMSRGHTHLYIRHVTCLTHECVMSHICMNHLTHVLRQVTFIRTHV